MVKVSAGKKVTELSTLADVIERYIKQQLKRSGNQIVEINRAQIANLFACVPSQINYVLSTRFSQERGYIIQSRRGGGGYIRILSVSHTSGSDDLSLPNLLQRIGDAISTEQVAALLNQVLDEQVIPSAKAQLISGIIHQETANMDDEAAAARMRAVLLRAMMILSLQKGYP